MQLTIKPVQILKTFDDVKLWEKFKIGGAEYIKVPEIKNLNCVHINTSNYCRILNDTEIDEKKENRIYVNKIPEGGLFYYNGEYWKVTHKFSEFDNVTAYCINSKYFETKTFLYHVEVVECEIVK